MIYKAPYLRIYFSYEPTKHELQCHNIIAADLKFRPDPPNKVPEILQSDLAIPCTSFGSISRSHAALFLLACLDTLSNAGTTSVALKSDSNDKHVINRQFTKEDYSVVNRFESEFIEKFHVKGPFKNLC